MSITNTTQRRRDKWLFGGNSNAIEAQEAQGQKELAKASQLPNEGLAAVLAKYPAIVDRGATVGDALFHDVTLPAGWAIKPTTHSMWSDLLDEAGTKVAAIFYKAAFYDRRADIQLERSSTD